MKPKIGERYKLWGGIYECLSMTPKGNAIMVFENTDKEFILYKESFHRLEKIKLSGKKVLVIGKFKDSDEIVSYLFKDIESYKNYPKNSNSLIPLAIKEVEWEEGEGL